MSAPEPAIVKASPVSEAAVTDPVLPTAPISALCQGAGNVTVVTGGGGGGGDVGGTGITSMAEIIALSTMLTNFTLSVPLLTVTGKDRIMAVLGPAAARRSKLKRICTPWAKTLNFRWPGRVMTGSAKYNLSV